MKTELTEQEKLEAALSVVNDSVIWGKSDIAETKRILPRSYEVEEGKHPNSIHCKSKTGIKQGKDSEDDEHWSYIMKAFKRYFSERFLEVSHNVNFCHTDFTIYLKERH